MKGLELSRVAVIGVADGVVPAPEALTPAEEDAAARAHDLQRERGPALHRLHEDERVALRVLHGTGQSLPAALIPYANPHVPRYLIIYNPKFVSGWTR